MYRWVLSHLILFLKTFKFVLDTKHKSCYIIDTTKQGSTYKEEMKMMKTAFTEQYYKNDAVRERIKRNKRVMNLEDNLKHEMSIFENIGIDNEGIEKLTKIYALQIYNKARKELVESKQLYLKVRSDGNCLGYTSKTQEIKAVAEIVETFEYNCVLLKEFKEKYCI